MSYFKVGEECILQSKQHPELNGDCIVLEVLAPESRRYHLGGDKWESVYGYNYVLSINNTKGLPWAEQALRKKHKPSTESLSTMIEELNKVKV